MITERPPFGQIKKPASGGKTETDPMAKLSGSVTSGPLNVSSRTTLSISRSMSRTSKPGCDEMAKSPVNDYRGNRGRGTGISPKIFSQVHRIGLKIPKMATRQSERPKIGQQSPK
jgi:hypothetical protein